jgi:hypothetical protein
MKSPAVGAQGRREVLSVPTFTRLVYVSHPLITRRSASFTKACLTGCYSRTSHQEENRAQADEILSLERG